MIWKARGGIERIHEEKLCYKKKNLNRARLFCLYTHTHAAGMTREWGVRTQTLMFYRGTVITCPGQNILFVYRIATHAEMQEVKRLFIRSLFNNKHS